LRNRTLLKTVIIVCSSLGDDESVGRELLDRADNEVKKRYARRIYVPRVAAWQDFAASLLEADLFIASRLHGAILGFMTQTPTVAISIE
jgi:polysaccharide pyruvyl transferase WcaK-like protein